MDVLFLLIPVSVLLVLALLALFGWALFGGQFDNLEREGERILHDDAPAASQVPRISTPVDGDQAAGQGSPEQ